MTAREWLNVLAILNSIDEVPGMPIHPDEIAHCVRNGISTSVAIQARQEAFRSTPVRFFQRADEPTQAAIWAEVERRLAGGA